MIPRTLQATKKRIVVSQQSGESKVMLPAQAVTGPDGKAIVQNTKNQVIYSNAAERQADIEGHYRLQLGISGNEGNESTPQSQLIAGEPGTNKASNHRVDAAQTFTSAHRASRPHHIRVPGMETR